MSVPRIVRPERIINARDLDYNYSKLVMKAFIDQQVDEGMQRIAWARREHLGDVFGLLHQEDNLDTLLDEVQAEVMRRVKEQMGEVR